MQYKPSGPIWTLKKRWYCRCTQLIGRSNWCPSMPTHIDLFFFVSLCFCSITISCDDYTHISVQIEPNFGDFVGQTMQWITVIYFLEVSLFLTEISIYHFFDAMNLFHSLIVNFKTFITPRLWCTEWIFESCSCYWYIFFAFHFTCYQYWRFTVTVFLDYNKTYRYYKYMQPHRHQAIKI